MQKDLIKVAVTGGAGQIAYSLLFRIASGEVFGPDQKLSISIVEVPEFVKTLEGIKMELQDCAYPLLQEVSIGSDPSEQFKDIDFAILVGAKPRGPGMERGDLLKENSKIFIEQGKALEAVAKKDVKVLVVGNPCNTNALIAMTYAPSISKKNFFAMTRLDQNRAVAQLSLKSGRAISEIEDMFIWGNHSSTQVPDYFNAKIGGKSVQEIIQDQNWLETTFISTVQKRGAAIIEARGKSSAASAATAIIDSIKSIVKPTENEQYYSLAVSSDGNPYGIQEGLIYSFPCKTNAKGTVEIVEGIALNESLIKKLKISEDELVEEKELSLKHVK